MRLISTAWVFIGLLFVQNALADSEDNLLQLLGTGHHLALMRHALAPGTGDPSDFSLRQCSTQRNLNSEGRSQSVATGKFFLDQGIKFDTVYSSQWCRCLETAKLLNIGAVQELPLLNSFYQSMHLAEERTQELQDWLATTAVDKPILLVTHQVNISALTGEFARSCEIVIVEFTDDGQIAVKGKIAPQ